jgi:hypothetical protein
MDDVTSHCDGGAARGAKAPQRAMTFHNSALYRVFQKELTNGIPDVAVWRVLQKWFIPKGVHTIHRSTTRTIIS